MLPENHRVFKQLRSVVDEFGPGRVVVGETYPPKIEDLLAYYGKVNDEFHMPFNCFLLAQSKLDANAFRRFSGPITRVVTASELQCSGRTSAMPAFQQPRKLGCRCVRSDDEVRLLLEYQ
jgi:hypothetical protein